MPEMEGMETAFMRRALALARLGEGKVAPNPMVGCVIVHPEYGIIGEGWHPYFGGPHAEVQAIASVKNSDWLTESTLYVTLEPCSHFGKTPPCADLLVAKQIPKVVICCGDPHPLVAGRGIAKLQSAGIEVVTGVLEAEGLLLNRHFFKSQQNKRPFVTLKWAETADGFLARKDGSSKWISSPQSRILVHKWRAQHQAIWVGRGTLRTDNPLLTVRDWSGKSPIRLVVDPRGTLTQLALLENHDAETWIFGQNQIPTGSQIRYFELQHPEGDYEGFMAQLFALGIQSVFVEGGSFLLRQLLQAGMWDEALVFRSEVRFGEGIPAPKPDARLLTQISASGTDGLWVYESQTH